MAQKKSKSGKKVVFRRIKGKIRPITVSGGSPIKLTGPAATKKLKKNSTELKNASRAANVVVGGAIGAAIGSDFRVGRAVEKSIMRVRSTVGGKFKSGFNFPQSKVIKAGSRRKGALIGAGIGAAALLATNAVSIRKLKKRSKK